MLYYCTYDLTCTSMHRYSRKQNKKIGYTTITIHVYVTMDNTSPLLLSMPQPITLHGLATAPSFFSFPMMERKQMKRNCKYPHNYTQIFKCMK